MRRMDDSYSHQPDMLDEFDADKRLRLPMQPDSRSLNLSNAAAVIVYEAWRQLGFKGSAVGLGDKPREYVLGVCLKF